jgi:hypothetical protein
MDTPIANIVKKRQNAIALEKKRKAEETHFIPNPKVSLPKVFLHERKG